MTTRVPPHRERTKALFVGFGQLTIISQAANLLPLLVVPHVYRSVGASAFGACATGIAVGWYVTLLVDFGTNLALVPPAVRRADSAHRLQKLAAAASLMRCSIASLVLFATVSTLVLLPLTAELRTSLALGTLMGSLNALFPQWYFQATGQLSRAALLTIVPRGLALAATFAAVRSAEDYYWYPALLALAAAVSTASAMASIRMSPLFRASRRQAKAIAHHSVGFFMGNMAGSAYTVSNTIVLSAIGGTTAAGVYAAAERFYSGAQRLLQPALQLIYPEIVRRKSGAIAVRLLWLALAGYAVVSAIIYPAIEPAAILVYGPDSSAIAEVFKVLWLTLGVTLPSLLLGHPYLTALGRPRDANNSVAVAGVAHLSTLLVLAALGKLSAVSVAYALLATESLLATMRIVAVLRLRKELG